MTLEYGSFRAESVNDGKFVKFKKIDDDKTICGFDLTDPDQAWFCDKVFDVLKTRRLRDMHWRTLTIKDALRFASDFPKVSEELEEAIDKITERHKIKRWRQLFSMSVREMFVAGFTGQQIKEMQPLIAKYNN